MPDGPDRNADTATTGRKRTEGRQNVLVNEGAAPDPSYDGNERADDRVEIVEPDAAPSPRAESEAE